MNAPVNVETIPDWVLASPRKIDRSLQRAAARRTGGWYAVEPSRSGSADPRTYEIAGHEVVLWSNGETLVASPAACPHMGADLSTGRVCKGKLVCPWHGLELDAAGYGKHWRPFPVYDDGLLIWVQLPGELARTDRPIVADRPKKCVRTGYRFELACDPEDVIANRLDPWHGAHLHPHSFSRLKVISDRDDILRLKVGVKVMGMLNVESEVTFHCPTAHSIVMTIVSGPGSGSVLETHVTPIRPGRTAVIETMSATSQHPLFRAILINPLLRAFMRRRLIQRAKRLWVEDSEYVERRYALRRCKPQSHFDSIQGGS